MAYFVSEFSGLQKIGNVIALNINVFAIVVLFANDAEWR